ncbi:MAG TPA: DinB family protein [Pyrinomonadaceae bacterium]
MQSVLEDFERTINTSYDRLQRITEAQSREAAAPGKWSKKELIGHLIDSAANNHHRFVKAQFTDQLLITRYDQEAWVKYQDYSNESWAQLLQFWKSYNLHLLHVASRIPEEKRRTVCQLEDFEVVSLGFLVEDYVSHLKHHLKQILG